MATAQNASITGDAEIIKNLESLKSSMQRKIMRRAMAKGSKVVARIARQKVAVESGTLKKSIKSQVTKKGSGRVYTSSKAADENNKKPEKYAHLVEFGTRHSAAKPFMRPALDEGRGRAIAEIANTAREELSKLEASGWR